MSLLRPRLERDGRDLEQGDKTLVHVSGVFSSFVLTDALPKSWIARPDTYNIDTSNVLFILSGAFVGLDTLVKRRVVKGVRA